MVENPPTNAGDTREGLIPGSGRSPRGGSGNLLRYFCLKTPWIEEPGWLQSMELERAGLSDSGTNEERD